VARVEHTGRGGEEQHVPKCDANSLPDRPLVAGKMWTCQSVVLTRIQAECFLPHPLDSRRHTKARVQENDWGKKESAIEHGDENAIEAPRNYNEFSVNGNNLNSVSHFKGAPQNCPFPPETEEQGKTERNSCRVTFSFCRTINAKLHS
jgi:hypothetical protein